MEKITDKVKIGTIARYLNSVKSDRKYITKNNDMFLSKNRLYIMKWSHQDFDPMSDDFINLAFDEYLEKGGHDILCTKFYQYLADDFRQFDKEEAQYHKLGKLTIAHKGNYVGDDAWGNPIGKKFKEQIDVVCVPGRYMTISNDLYKISTNKLDELLEELKSKFIEPKIIALEDNG